MIIALQTLVFFRQSLVTALNRLLSPYYKQLKRTLSPYDLEDEEDELEVFAEFDDEKGVVFYPPMYAQRYAAVSDCLMDERWCGKLFKVVDLGYHDMSFIKYLKDLPGVDSILGVDLESLLPRCSSDLLDCGDYGSKRDNPLQITLFQGNAADPDYRLIGCDAVVAIEMIEHMLPHDLDRLVHTIFGFIKPWVAVITTPNGDFNELFKSLEPNGFRRLDHFFEWSREQFHDWCSNIVLRYPQFSVSCQGIGPGPAGTEHLGCCSQLALFVNNCYVKQQDLNLNSLAKISNVPSPHSLEELVVGFQSPLSAEYKARQNMESPTEFLYRSPVRQSCVTLILTSPAYSYTAIEYKDKTSQCDLDAEAGKNFLMFNDEDMYYTMLLPRRSAQERVYEIGDVASRLNCTTFQARKFSKTTQNIMAKHSFEFISHTREVVGEIHNLTKMLNLNKEPATTQNGFTWYNINWGENAPYWNQYYKVVRDYNYPFEEKSEECRILDLISEEINQLIDRHYSNEITARENLEIPIQYLMQVVRHITNDVERVKDLLEWNGYMVSGDYVVHTRAILDSMSIGTEEYDWPEHDTISEFDGFEVQSIPVSDRSGLMPDTKGWRIRRALDKKVKSLRLMLSADEDIYEELENVVCKLMKLALRTSKQKQEPPPVTWMQLKLLDLLTLTENAIAIRRKYYNANYPSMSDFDQNIKELVKGDHAADMIVSKYNHLIYDENCEVFDDLDFGYEHELDEQHDSYDLLLKGYLPKSYMISVNNGQVSLVNENLELVPYVENLSDQESSKCARRTYTQSPTGSYVKGIFTETSRKRSYEMSDDEHKSDETKKKKGKTNVAKKIRAKISSHSSKKIKSKRSSDHETYSSKSKKHKEPKKLQSSLSKPIPESLIELCHPAENTLLHSNNYQFSASERCTENKLFTKHHNELNIAATEESVLINIVMDDKEETIALRRSIGTDPDLNGEEIDQIICNVENEVNYSSFNKLHNSPVSASQTIFLFDINEPSTSKGVRHISMDVQCGTDTALPPNGLVTPKTTATNIPKYSNGIRIDSFTKVAVKNKCMDSGTCTNIGNQGCESYCIFSKGIKIGDSRDNFVNKASETTAMPSMRKPFNFGISTETDNGTNQYNKHTSGSGFPNSPGCVSNEINVVDYKHQIEKNEFNGEEITSITSRTQSLDMSPILQADGSLSNLLINDSNTDLEETFYKRSPREFSPRQTPGIIIRNSFDDSETSNNFVDSIFTNCDPQTHKNDLPTEASKVYTSVKVIDLVNEVTIEQDSKDDSLQKVSSLTPCKILDSRYIPEKPYEFNFKFKNKLQRNMNMDSNNFFQDDLKGQTNKIMTRLDDHASTISSVSYTKVNLSRVANDILDTSVNSFTPTKSFGFRVKDSEENVVKKVEFSTTRVELLCDTEKFRTTGQLKQSKTEIVKSVRSKRTERSDFHDSNNRLSPESKARQGTAASVNTRETTLVSQSLSRYNEGISYKEKTEQSEISLIKLGYGGVHIHSFKEKQISEDVIFEGLWKRNASKFPRKLSSAHTILAKKRSDLLKGNKIKKDLCNQKLQIKTIGTKIASEPLNTNKIREPLRTIKIKNDFSKKKMQVKTTTTKDQTKKDPKKLQKVRSTKPIIKIKQESVVSEQVKKTVDTNLLKTSKPGNNSLPKVSSKKVSSAITSKHIKSTRAIIKTPNCAKHAEIVNKDCRAKSEPIRKEHIDYLPPYLRRKLFSKDRKLNSTDSSTIDKLKSKDDFRNHSYDELKKASYTKLTNYYPRTNINYLVFRNDIEKTNPSANASQSPEIINKNESTTKRKSLNKRTSSPLSQASSTCSTSDSVTTVRQSNNWNRASNRRSTSSNKSSLVNTDSETSPSTIKIRKFSKKSNKVSKKLDGKDNNNKENTPESSKNCYSEKQMCFQKIKSAFISKSKNMFVSKIEDTSLATDDKYQNSAKSNIKIPAIESNEDKVKPRNSSKKKSNDSSSNEEVIKNHESIKSDPSNLVLLVEPIKDNIYIQEKKSQDKKSQHTNEPVLNNNLLTEWFERGKYSAIDRENTENGILTQMRQLVEEKLDFVSGNLNDTSLEVNLSNHTTVIATHDTDLDNTLTSEIENAMNRTLEAVVSNDESGLDLQNAFDGDLISFKSVTSASRFSDYFLAENDSNKSASKNKTASSVLDIFERKDVTSRVQNAPGSIAAQVFSGFSIDDTVMGDQPDYMAADSELGVEFSRQAASEEMFLSGRSSYETYETCVFEEDIDVPDWLFHAMNTHMEIEPDPIAQFDSETGSPSYGYSRLRSADEEEDQPELVPRGIPLAQPVFDANGNIVEPSIGLDAGAGDGRGMHSDYSQDSSGRGSSLSSSDASSSQHGEAILIDPSAYTNQFELFHEPVGSSLAVTTLVVPIGSSDAARQRPTAMVSTSRNVQRPYPLLTSDGEADVSSIDTDDVADSS